MLFPWGRNLEIGNDIIENQHREMFSRVNKLLSSMADGNGRGEVGKVIAYITKNKS